MGRMKFTLSLAFVGLLLPALSGAAPDDLFGDGGAPAGGPPAKPTKTAEKSLVKEQVKPTSEGEAKTAASDHKTAEICQCVSEADSSSVERIERALRGPLHSNGLDFAQTPLKDLVEQLATDYGIPVQLDKAAIDEAGINGDQGVTVNLHNISLQSALKIMLKTVQLTYIIRDEVLFITTPEAAARDLKVCVYNVSELVSDRGTDLESVADVIRSCIATDTWAINGGGQSEIRTIKPGLLVVSQTSEVHEQVRDLLRAIRKTHEQEGAASNAAAKSAGIKHEDVVTRSYILQMNPTNETNSLRSQIRDLIVNALPDETWTGRLTGGQAVLLAVFHDRIVVQQTPAVQEKVEKILTDSGIATAATQPNAPGAPGGFGAIQGPGGGPFGAGPEGAVGSGMAPAAFGARFDGPGAAPGIGPSISPAPHPGE
jgi:hypothetical protein